MQAQRRDEGVEDVPGSPERYGKILMREDDGGAAKPLIRGDRALLGDREIQIRECQDAVAHQRLLAGLADDAQLADAPEQKRKAGQAFDCTAARYLMKSTEMVADAFAVMVVVTLRSPNCGFLNTISRTPSRMATLAIGVSPAFSPSM